MVSVTRFIVGLSMALLSCFLSSLGLTLQRLCALRELARKEQRLHLHNSDLELITSEETGRRWIRRPLYTFGVFLYVIASVPDVASYILIPQVVCSAVACFRLVVVTLMACTMLGEKLSRWQVLGMLGCTIGTLMCVCFGPVRMEREAIMSHFSDSQVAIYLSVGGGIALLLFVFDHLDSISDKCMLSVRFRGFTLPLVTGLLFAISKVFNTEIGFMPMSKNFLLDAPWMGTAAAIALLGLVNLYLNLRATRLMAVHVFIAVSFVWAIGLQFFQSVALFSELNGLSIWQVMLSIGGACLSLVGAIGLQLPQRLDGLEHQQEKSVSIESAPSQNGLDLQDRKATTLLAC